MRLAEDDIWLDTEDDFLLADLDEDIDDLDEEFGDDFDEEMEDEFFAEPSRWLDEWADETEIYDDLESELDDAPEAVAEALSEVLHEDYSNASPEQLEEALYNMWETMTPAEAFNFKKILRTVKKAGQSVLRDPAVGQIAKTALPIAGGAVGTFFGGPIGTALGTQLGQAAGSAFAGGSPKRPAATAVRSVPTQGPQAGSAAANQLLQLTRDPNMLKSLLALALGAHGRTSIPVAGAPGTVPVGAFMNLLGSLAGKAAADADALARGYNSAYSIDSEGAISVESFQPDESADALYNLLADAEDERLDPDTGDFADDEFLESEDLFPEDDGYKDCELLPAVKRANK